MRCCSSRDGRVPRGTRRPAPFDQRDARPLAPGVVSRGPRPFVACLREAVCQTKKKGVSKKLKKMRFEQPENLAAAHGYNNVTKSRLRADVTAFGKCLWVNAGVLVQVNTKVFRLFFIEKYA